MNLVGVVTKLVGVVQLFLVFFLGIVRASGCIHSVDTKYK